MKKLHFFDKVVYIINVLVAIVLLLSYILPFVPPKTFPLLAVISLSVPILIIINVLFAIYWLIKFKRQVLLSIIVLVIGIQYVRSLYKSSSANDITTSNEISVLSYNVRLFNLYEWIKDDDLKQKMKKLVKETNSDVLCFQEFYQDKTMQFPEYKYEYTYIKSKRSKTGLAIYSKYPILRKGSIQFPNTSNNAIYVDVLKANDTIRFYNIHLESLHINPDVSKLQEQDSEKLIERIGGTFKRQQEQVAILLDHMNVCAYKKVVVGDFNNSAYSYVYRQIKGDMIDAFKVAGTGFGKTFDFKLFPMRIDFILSDESLAVNAFKNYDQKYSDHFPIYARFDLTSPE